MARATSSDEEGAKVSQDAIKSLNVDGRKLISYLKNEGLYKPLKDYKVHLEPRKITYGEGYPITAFEKFLGYYDKDVNTAFAPSVSMVTDFSIAKCFCRYLEEPGIDFVSLDGKSDEIYDRRARKALGIFRKINNVKGSFQFTTVRSKRYTMAKGLGESAAIAAATARALVANVFGSEAASDDSFVSRYAKLVSGSGSRSATGGISVWVSFPGIPEEQSYGVRIPFDTENLHFAVYPDFNEIKTLKAHDIAASSDFYERWVTQKYRKIINLMKDRSIVNLMQQAQLDTFKLNALMMTGGDDAGTIIQTKGSLEIINHVREFQSTGKHLYMTADTGPSIVVMTDDKRVLDAFIKEEKKRSGRTPLTGTIPDRPKSIASSADLRGASKFFEEIGN